MPASRNAAMAGPMIVVSSSPSAPCSPACGLSPAIGEPRPRDAEVALQRRGRGPRGGDDRFGGQHGDRVSQRGMHGDRHHAQFGTGQHHDLPAMRAGQLGEEFGVARIGEARVVQRGLVDRVGHHAADLAAQAERGGAFDRGDHRRGVGLVGMAGSRRSPQRDRQHGKCGGEDGARCIWRCDSRRSARRATARRAASDRRVPRNRDRCGAVPARHAGEFAADAGGIAHGESNGFHAPSPNPLPQGEWEICTPPPLAGEGGGRGR